MTMSPSANAQIAFAGPLSLLQFPHLHCASLLGSGNPEEVASRRYGRQICRISEYFSPPAASFSLYQGHRVCHAGRGFSGRCRPQLACLLRLSLASFHHCRCCSRRSLCGCRNGATCSPEAEVTIHHVPTQLAIPQPAPRQVFFPNPLLAGSPRRRFVGRHIF
jgi:hypothetical protein